MEAEKEIIKEKEYVNGDKHAVDNTARTLGIIGTVGTGISLLGGMRGGIGSLFGGNYGMPENVNINTLGGSASHSAPTAFEAYAHECADTLALTNEIWGLKVNTQDQMYKNRDVDIAEKFQLYKSQVDADFGLYKSTRDSFDALLEKHNADTFSLYKGYRDGFDVMASRISDLEKKVAVNEAVRPYQDKLLQCEIGQALTTAINYTDKKTCYKINGILGLPSTPTVTVLQGANNCGYMPTTSSSSSAAA